MGLRELVMGIPWVYRSFTSAIDRPSSQRWFNENVIRARPGMRILDIGCGTAEVLSRLHGVSYFGIDHNPQYLQRARDRFGDLARFECWDVTDTRLRDLGKFDIVFLLGVLHHLTDAQVTTMLAHAAQVLKPEGRLITLDVAIEDRQHPVARILAKLDRGRYARSADGYGSLVGSHFKLSEVIVRHDLLRVPYTHVVITATSVSGNA